MIASRVNLSVQKFPGVLAAPLIIGTIAGSGGKFLQDGIQLACGTLPGENQVLLPQLRLVQCHLEKPSASAQLDKTSFKLCCV